MQGPLVLSHALPTVTPVSSLVNCAADSFLLIANEFVTSNGEGVIFDNEQGRIDCTSDSCCQRVQNMGSVDVANTIVVCEGSATSATALSIGGSATQSLIVNAQNVPAVVTMQCPSSASSAARGVFEFTRTIGPAALSSANSTVLLPTECNQGFLPVATSVKFIQTDKREVRLN
jgi:hypothetical protein